jgi:hypothetical protein
VNQELATKKKDKSSDSRDAREFPLLEEQLVNPAFWTNVI